MICNHTNKRTAATRLTVAKHARYILSFSLAALCIANGHVFGQYIGTWAGDQSGLPGVSLTPLNNTASWFDPSMWHENSVPLSGSSVTFDPDNYIYNESARMQMARLGSG